MVRSRYSIFRSKNLNASFFNSCKCLREFEGGEFVFGVAFPDFESDYGSIEGTALMVGGRGYGYLLDDQLRIGGMGMWIGRSSKRVN